MATAIMFAYLVCASVFLIWCSVRTNLAYIVISEAELSQWRIERQNLVIIDLSPKAMAWLHGSVPNSLDVSERELASLLQWLPPQSTLVFCHRVHINHFDQQIEETLFRAAIDTVYVLDVRESPSVQKALRNKSASLQFGCD
jgi:hypothetical protein